MGGVLEKNLVLFFSLLPFPVKGFQLELSVRLLSYCILVNILITVLAKTDIFNLYKVPTIYKTYLQPIKKKGERAEKVSTNQTIGNFNRNEQSHVWTKMYYSSKLQFFVFRYSTKWLMLKFYEQNKRLVL
ncbi:hypothetical protein TorRG33x02_306080 [Trema orientale]|uniref:Uncharacterized protein n=1 Tax=Trema orientale TaxID=63057 RepID=A0A2P5BWT8_TREOI|nr:hypothetical protein TorRG33x02_306080 [Trema orientale]